MSKKSKIVMNADGFVVDERLASKGEVLAVEGAVAERMIATGRAVAADVLVRVSRSHMIGGHCREAGEEILVSESEARGLFHQGRAEILDLRELGEGTMPAPLPAPQPIFRRPDPYKDEPLIEVRIVRGFLAHTRFVTPDDGTIPLPETIAMNAVRAGAARLTGLAGLSWKASRFFAELANKGQEILAQASH